MVYCRRCGSEIDERDIYCPNCGAKQYSTNNYERESQGYYSYDVSPKSRLVLVLLCVFLGAVGAHRFYAGKIGTGILWICTGGCFGIGLLIDTIMCICGSFKDKEGLVIKDWQIQ